MSDGHFAIDSDDEMEDDADVKPTTTTNKKADNNNNYNDTSAPVHPLQAELMGTSSSSTGSNAAPDTAASTAMPTAATTTTTAPTMTAATTNHVVAAATTPVVAPTAPAPVMTTAATSPSSAGAMPAAAPPGSSASSPASLDAWRMQTSRFASNLANMAQRAATQVATVTAGTGPIMQNTTQNNNNMIQQQVGASLDNEQKSKLVSQAVELLPGEQVIMFVSHLLQVSDSTGFSWTMRDNPRVAWHCAMTYYRLCLISDTRTIQMPLSCMEKIETGMFTTSSNSTSYLGVNIVGKEQYRSLQFTTPNHSDTKKAQEALWSYAFPGRRNLGYLFAFESKRALVMASVRQNKVTLEPTLKRCHMPSEFARQNKFDKTPWRLWSNEQYTICSSYPSTWIGPPMDEHSLRHVVRQCAAFRSEGRIPACTWHDGGGASLWRSSQPKVGLQGNRNPGDERYLQHVMETAHSANLLSGSTNTNLTHAQLQLLTGGNVDLYPSAACRMKIMDLRPRSSAMANRTGGYGYENTSNYPGTTLQFCNIGNIHAVRDSFQKLQTLCQSPSSNDIHWPTLVEDTKWLYFVRLLWAASWEAAYWLHVHKMPVLLHCSHGWDRTSQVAALAQLLLDDYYRSLDGFATLVDKDFSSFGHPFHTRCGHGENKYQANTNMTNAESSSSNSNEQSPIFWQFLDCVYQIVSLYPDYFEFSTSYILELYEHVYSCRFGNFLCDTEREREQVAGIRQRTRCIWEYMEEKYPKREYRRGTLLVPFSTLLRHVHLWTDCHCRYGPKPTMRHGKYDEHYNTTFTVMNKKWKTKQELWKEILCSKEETKNEETNEEANKKEEINDEKEEE